MNPKRLVLFLAAAGVALSAHGADLLGVYRDALVSDPVFQSARAQYQAGLESLPQARAGYLPSVSGSASTFRNQLDTSVAPSIDYNSHSYEVILTQPLFRWQNWIAISQAERQVMQTESTFSTAKQDLILRVAQAYFDVLLAQDNVALSEAQKKAISEQLAQAKRNFEVGTSTIVDTLEAQARYDQAVAKEISDKNDLEVKKRALQQLVGKPADALTPLKDPLALATPKPANIEEWVTAASASSHSVAVCARHARDCAPGHRARQGGPLPDAGPLGLLHAFALAQRESRHERHHEQQRRDRAAAFGPPVFGRAHPVEDPAGAVQPRQGGTGSRRNPARRGAVGAPELPQRDERDRAGEGARAGARFHAEPARLHDPRARRGGENERRRAERAAAGVPDPARPAAGPLRVHHQYPQAQGRRRLAARSPTWNRSTAPWVAASGEPRGKPGAKTIEGAAVRPGETLGAAAHVGQAGGVAQERDAPPPPPRAHRARGFPLPRRAQPPRRSRN